MKRLSIFEDWFLAIITGLTLIGVLILMSISGCSSAIKRPDSDVLFINAEAQHLEGYNVLRDYDSLGNRNSSAKLIIRPAGDLSDINGWACTDPMGLRNIETSLKDARNYISKHCSCE